MNCTQAKTEIALLVGGDLEESSEALVRQHLSRCSACRELYARMQSMMQVIETAEIGSGAAARARECVANCL